MMDIEELKRLHADFPEINLSNFGVGEVDALNGWGIEVALMLPAIIAKLEAAQRENEHLRCALRYYAKGQHFMRGDNDAWDTVSGEPQNFWCDEAGTATVEDGSFAAHSLRNNMEWSAEDAIPLEGEKPYLSLASFDKESE